MRTRTEVIVNMDVKARSRGGNLLRWGEKITHGLTCNLTTPPFWGTLSQD